jgi:hypothetical protein
MLERFERATERLVFDERGRTRWYGHPILIAAGFGFLVAGRLVVATAEHGFRHISPDREISDLLDSVAPVLVDPPQSASDLIWGSLYLALVTAFMWPLGCLAFCLPGLLWRCFLELVPPILSGIGRSSIGVISRARATFGKN